MKITILLYIIIGLIMIDFGTLIDSLDYLKENKKNLK